MTLAALLVAALPLAAQAPTPVQESNGMNAQEKANLKFDAAVKNPPAPARGAN